MKRKTKVLDDTDFSRRIDSVSKSVTECEIRIDVSARRSKRGAVAIALEIAVKQCSRRSFENLMKSNAATCVKRRAERRHVEVSRALAAAVRTATSNIRERGVHIRPRDAN